MKKRNRTRLIRMFHYANRRWSRAILHPDYPENDEEHATHPAVLRADFWRKAVHQIETYPAVLG